MLWGKMVQESCCEAHSDSSVCSGGVAFSLYHHFSYAQLLFNYAYLLVLVFFLVEPVLIFLITLEKSLY